MSQVCNTCHIDQPESNYYLQDGYRLFKKCKSCIAPKEKKGRMNGFSRLSPETQAAIKIALADRTQKVPKIAEKYGIKYNNLAYWIRKNKVA